MRSSLDTHCWTHTRAAHVSFSVCKQLNPSGRDGGHPPAPWLVDAPGVSVWEIWGLWCLSAGLPVPRHATFGSHSFYRPAKGGWKSWPGPRLGRFVGTPSAGWASGATWWPLGRIVGCRCKPNSANLLNQRFSGDLISKPPEAAARAPA